ncbi:DNA polymerase IV [uncultured Propionibacterium sp.]|uniref:DNA polymerase IV n=1 Tax=uncultured Propionibacterium sp. TaxID=218066 RepID=UPI00292EDED6|nr:DNA polymerase IV [uncultured Propionibacterium sp.]
MRSSASVLHLDLDAFFASVEQRDKPSLVGKPVIVGGVGGRGVVATASYEARALGVHSAMGTGQARHLAPHAAYLATRFAAYRESSRIVMALLGELSPLVEPVSIDEAFVDLAAGGRDVSPPALAGLVDDLRRGIAVRTEGLHASVGVGSSKFIAKLASQAAKPDGARIIAPGRELDFIAPMSVRAIPGIGPATTEKLNRLGIRTVTELREASPHELVRELGRAVGEYVHGIAFAQDERPVLPRGEAKSISVEDTFEEDITGEGAIAEIIAKDARLVAARLNRAGLFARTVTFKARMADFSTVSRSRTLLGATDHPERIAAVAQGLAGAVDPRAGVRLVGVGVSNFTQAAQEELFEVDDGEPATGTLVQYDESAPPVTVRRADAGYLPGMDVEHEQWGRGWVWGAGHGVVTVRFERRGGPIGPVRSLRADDPALRRAEPLALAFAVPESDEDGHGPGWARAVGDLGGAPLV